MNVLLTCAGRRSYAVQLFREALQGRGLVFACDSNAQAGALQEADQGFVVPPVHAANYVDALLELCGEQHIALVIPALEPELPLFAAHQAQFRKIGTTPLISSPELIATCYDKVATASFLVSHGLPVPKTFLSLASARTALLEGELTFPVVVKPRWGVGSMAMAFAEDHEELELNYHLSKKHLARSFLAGVSATDPEHCVLIQERLSGAEYGLDVINDLHGRHVCTFVRRTLRRRAGQTDQAVTLKDERFDRLGRFLGEQLRHVGILDCDVFVKDDACYVIDLNPRLGGAYPFSHVAGANFPAVLIAWILGEKPEPAWFQVAPNLTVSRGDTFLVAHHPKVQSAGRASRTRRQELEPFAPIHR